MMLAKVFWLFLSMMPLCAWSLALPPLAGKLNLSRLGAPPANQETRPLSLKQLEDMLKIPAPDEVLAGEIKARGLAFKLNQTTLEKLLKLGAGAKTTEALSLLVQQPTLRCTGGSSAEVVKKAWGAWHENKLDETLACTQAVINKWGGDADRLQEERLHSGQCEVKPTPKEKGAFNSKYYALNDVAVAWLLRGRALAAQGQAVPAQEAFNRVTRSYNCAFSWDPKAKGGQGLFISVANSAERGLGELKAKAK